MFVTLMLHSGSVCLNLTQVTSVTDKDGQMYVYLTDGKSYTLTQAMFTDLNDAIAEFHRQQASLRDSLRAIASRKA